MILFPSISKDRIKSNSRVKVFPDPVGPTNIRCWAARVLRSIKMLLPVFMSSPKYNPFSSVRELGFLEGKSAAVWYENSSHQEEFTHSGYGWAARNVSRCR